MNLFNNSIFIILESESLVSIQDGDLTTCVDSSTLMTLRNDKNFGDVTIFKDIDINSVKLKVYYNALVNCTGVNIFYYKLKSSNCNTVKMAAHVTGSSLTVTTCYYELRCNQGDVACTIELLIKDAYTSFSLCEIIVL